MRYPFFLSETEVKECGGWGETSENNKIKLKKKLKKNTMFLTPTFPECLSSGRLSESTKDEAKSTEGNLTNKGLSPN